MKYCVRKYILKPFWILKNIPFYPFPMNGWSVFKRGGVSKGRECYIYVDLQFLPLVAKTHHKCFELFNTHTHTYFIQRIRNSYPKQSFKIILKMWLSLPLRFRLNFKICICGVIILCFRMPQLLRKMHNKK